MAPRLPRALLSVALVLALAAAGCIQEPRAEPLAPQSVQGGSGQGGGDVGNVLPSFQAFSGSLATADNSGTSVEVFAGRVFDANTEADLKEVKVRLSGVVSGEFTHKVTADDRAAASEPASFGSDGFKAWTEAPDDGVLHFKFRFTYPLGTSLGTATAIPVVFDESGGDGVQGPADTTTVTSFSQITVASVPVNLDGTLSASATWGLWTASPGDASVEARNFLKLTNTGQRGDATVVIDFSAAAFSGPDSRTSIPIAGNVEFAWWEDASPGSTAPSEGAFSFLPANADGSVALAFGGLGRVIYVKYRVKQLPSVLVSQSYGASFTATEL